MNDEVRDALKQARCLFLDFFDAFLGPLERELGAVSAHVLGRAHGMADLTAYTMRINATNFALANDDGAQTRDYERADVILLGVSRSGKTPTCVYMALQYGAFAANYPLTEDDLDGVRLPAVVEPYRSKLFGLTIEPGRLQQIRQERRPDSRYASRAAVRLRGARGRAAVRAPRHPVPRNDRYVHRGDREPRARAPRDPAARAAVTDS